MSAESDFDCLIFAVSSGGSSLRALRCGTRVGGDRLGCVTAESQMQTSHIKIASRVEGFGVISSEITFLFG